MDRFTITKQQIVTLYEETICDLVTKSKCVLPKVGAPFGAICPLARTKYVNIPTLQGDLADDDATNYVVRAKSVQTASSRLIFEKPSPTDFLQITTTQVKTCLWTQIPFGKPYGEAIEKARMGRNTFVKMASKQFDNGMLAHLCVTEATL